LKRKTPDKTVSGEIFIPGYTYQLFRCLVREKTIIANTNAPAGKVQREGMDFALGVSNGDSVKMTSGFSVGLVVSVSTGASVGFGVDVGIPGKPTGSGRFTGRRVFNVPRPPVAQ